MQNGSLCFCLLNYALSIIFSMENQKFHISPSVGISVALLAAVIGGMVVFNNFEQTKDAFAAAEGSSEVAMRTYDLAHSIEAVNPDEAVAGETFDGE